MVTLTPFRALRPAPNVAATVASVPYDVVNTAEARALAEANPLSFLRVTRAEVDLPPETSAYDAAVYAQASHNLEALKREAPLLIEEEPSLYFYRLKRDGREQTGLAGCFSIDEYDRGTIKKHEKTRREKEDDRTRHIIELRAQTGLVFLTYRASPVVAEVAGRVMAGAALYDFIAPDGVSHTVWRVAGDEVAALVAAFGALDALYIADGHHRMASAARARTELENAGHATAGSRQVVAVAFPDSEVRILPYNRVVTDLTGLSPEAFLAAVDGQLELAPGPAEPARRGEVAMYLAGKWYTLSLPAPPAGSSRADTLDVELLHRHVLAPMLKIGDVRADKRIDFIGGSRGTHELERLVADGVAAIAFSMYPVSIDDLLAISDEGAIMPPKSTWFEPKVRDGLLVHLI